MKTLAIISYAIGCILLLVTCFTTSITATWWLGIIAIITLIAGCIFQYNSNHQGQNHYRHTH